MIAEVVAPRAAAKAAAAPEVALAAALEEKWSTRIREGVGRPRGKSDRICAAAARRKEAVIARPGSFRACPRCSFARHVPDGSFRQLHCGSPWRTGPFRCGAQPCRSGWHAAAQITADEAHNLRVKEAHAEEARTMQQHPPRDKTQSEAFFARVRARARVGEAPPEEAEEAEEAE